MKTIMIAAALMTAGSAARADGYKAMARDLAAAAKEAGVTRVAVMPFEAFDGGSARDGWNISEKLVTQLVKTGKVQALERSRLQTLFEEHSLGRAGALDPKTLREMGKVVSAEAMIVGSFTTDDRELVVNARLIDVETGVIIAASERRADRDWFDLPIRVAAPALTVEAPTLISESELPAADTSFPEIDLRDALSDESSGADEVLTPRDCDNAATTVDRLEARILDLKARYWARKLKDGLSGRTLKANPGSTISDPELKQEFYDKLKAWYSRSEVPALDEAETKRFLAVDRKAYELAQYCGL